MVDESVVLKKDVEMNNLSSNKTSLSFDKVQKEGNEMTIVRDKIQLYKSETSDANNWKNELITARSKAKSAVAFWVETYIESAKVIRDCSGYQYLFWSI